MRLSDALADITQTQTYHNNTDQTLNLIYIFPLHPSASLYRFEVHFEPNRVTKGVIFEKEEAEEAYNKAV